MRPLGDGWQVRRYCGVFVQQGRARLSFKAGRCLLLYPAVSDRRVFAYYEKGVIMLAKVLSFGLQGIETYPIEVEVDVANGLPCVTVVGMADTAIRESKERVKSAIKNSGFSWPQERITINLAPSDIKKEGAEKQGLSLPLSSLKLILNFYPTI